LVFDLGAALMASLSDLAKMDVKVPSLRVPKAPRLRGGGSAKPARRGAQLRAKRGAASSVVGLDVQPGYVAAVQARSNGALVIQRAAGISLPPETVREGELLDEGLLTDTLRELFHDSKLPRRVRLGIANQRTVLRVLELPPIEDRKSLDAAVRFQAQDHMPMPLAGAVLDFQPLGVVATPAGPRQRVVVVAAQRDMVEKMLKAVQAAGLRAAGVDLSAFAMIRALHRRDAGTGSSMPEAQIGDEVGPAGSTLYLNVGGLTNLAIAEGLACRFTRMVSGGLESMASELAARHSVALREARELLCEVDLGAEEVSDQVAADACTVLAGGVREIAGEVRNSLDFHRSQGGGEVGGIVLSGAALEIKGFAQALEAELGSPLTCRSVEVAQAESEGVPADRLAIAAGLAVEEVPA
jgi:type IV pilus assembly protein PilM